MEEVNRIGNSTCDKNTLRILHINIQCISNKFNELEIHTKRTKVDVICINEHWLQSDELAAVKIPNFKLANFFCRSERRHGGVCIYVRDGIDFRALNLRNESVELDMELTGITLGELVVLSVYRSPAGNFKCFINILSEILERYCKNFKLLIAGDFNVKFNTGDASAVLLCNTFQTFGIRATNYQNTRQAACLDNIFVSDAVCVNIHLDNSLSSDHCGLVAETYILPQNTAGETIFYRPITDTGLFMLYNIIENINWSFTSEKLVNIEVRMNKTLNTLTEAIDYCFPLKSKVIFAHKPLVNWFTDELYNIREHMRRMNMLSHKCPGLISVDQLKQCKNTYRAKLPGSY